MSGHIDNRESGLSEQAGQLDRMLTWHASRAMLPLVGSIAGDIVTCYQQLGQLRPELVRLERDRRNLAWEDRSRRYQLEDEVTALELRLKSCRAELEALGVALLEENTGLVGFPTVVNDRAAFFSWKPGEGELAWWNYAGDRVRRSVPEEWTQQELPRAVRKVRSRRK